MPAPLMPAPITIRSNGRSKVRGGRGARISLPPSHRTKGSDVSRYVAAIDQGTSSSRCILFDRDGAVAGSAQREHAQIHPQAGWVEHDPLEIVANVRAVVDEAVAAAGASAADVAAIGITNQRETTVLWERASGKPVAN